MTHLDIRNENAKKKIFREYKEYEEYSKYVHE